VTSCFRFGLTAVPVIEIRLGLARDARLNTPANRRRHAVEADKSRIASRHPN
jgi:hypothetical protein